MWKRFISHVKHENLTSTSILLLRFTCESCALIHFRDYIGVLAELSKLIGAPTNVKLNIPQLALANLAQIGECWTGMAVVLTPLWICQ